MEGKGMGELSRLCDSEVHATVSELVQFVTRLTVEQEGGWPRCFVTEKGRFPDEDVDRCFKLTRRAFMMFSDLRDHLGDFGFAAGLPPLRRSISMAQLNAVLARGHELIGAAEAFLEFNTQGNEWVYLDSGVSGITKIVLQRK